MCNMLRFWYKVPQLGVYSYQNTKHGHDFVRSDDNYLITAQCIQVKIYTIPKVKDLYLSK